MNFYLDTADPEATRRLLGTGLFQGVTSNPVIPKAAGLGPDKAQVYYDTAEKAGARQIFIQIFGADVPALLAQAERYCALGPRVVIKVACTAAGAAVAARLEARGVPVLLTAVHDSRQTLTAMAARASFVTPYLGEMNASGRNGLEQVLSMLRILRANPGKTRLLMAGFHDIATMITLAEAGMECLTITPGIADTLFAQPETEAMAAFFDRASGL